MTKRKKKNPFPWLSSFNERQFEPFIRAIGQSTLLWNDLHEWLGHLYTIAMGAGYVTVYLRAWNAITNDRAKRDMLLAAAQFTFVDEAGRFQTDLQRKSFDAIKYLCDESRKLEDDRNNAIHAPLRSSYTGRREVYAASAFGNIRARNLENKYLLKEYERLRDTARLLRNYAAEVHDPMCGKPLAWPDTPKLPDRGGTKRPPPHPPTPPEEPLLLLKS